MGISDSWKTRNALITLFKRWLLASIRESDALVTDLSLVIHPPMGKRALKGLSTILKARLNQYMRYPTTPISVSRAMSATTSTAVMGTPMTSSRGLANNTRAILPHRYGSQIPMATVNAIRRAQNTPFWKSPKIGPCMPMRSMIPSKSSPSIASISLGSSPASAAAAASAAASACMFSIRFGKGTNGSSKAGS